MINRHKIILAGVCITILLYFSLVAEKDLSTVETEVEPFFSVHLIAPAAAGPSALSHSAQIIEAELPKIGIEAELDLISWAALGPRCTDQEVGMYSEGGYDICFFGMSFGSPTSHLGESLQGVYSSGAIPPNGFNVPYWSPETGKGYYNYRAQESDDLIEVINSNINLTEVKAIFLEWQKVWYDVMPNIVIYNRYNVHAISSNLFGYDPESYPLDSIEDQWFTDDRDTIVLAASTGPKTFNSIQATDVYSQYSAKIPMDGLVGNTPSTETVLPTGSDRDTWMTDKYGTTETLALYPRMATDLGAFSTDGLQYNITVRDDIYWHDGHQFDAYDVAFSFQARLVPSIGASVYSNLLVPFGEDNKNDMSGNYSFVVEDKDTDGFFESISFQFQSIFAPWTTDYLGSLIYPEHILGDPTDHGFDTNGDFDVTQWSVLPTDWSTHSTSTGRSSDPGGYTGPIGTGSMIFKRFNAETKTVTLEKFGNIIWDGSAWVIDANSDHYNIDNLTDMPQTATIIIDSLDSAIAKIKVGNINIIDPQFTMASIFLELQAADAIQPVLSPENGWQSLYMNPKFVQDGVYHFQKKGVHHAISHIVPRIDIINSQLNGLGIPTYTPIPPSSWSTISESDMIDYKQSINASDGSKPLINTTTAYDNYSISLALDWLETEGYNVTKLRDGYKSPPASWDIKILPENLISGSILIAVSATYFYLRLRKVE